MRSYRGEMSFVWDLKATCAAAIVLGLFLGQTSVAQMATSTAAAPAACVAAPPGLVSWWTGDINENDIVWGKNPSAIAAVTLVPGEVRNDDGGASPQTVSLTGVGT